MKKEAAAAPELSIIVATYNAAATLERCLLSIIGQSWPSWELLISDGGSSDGTLDIINRYAGYINYWRSHPDGGIYDAWNQALAQAQGKYVCFLGADDQWSGSDALHRLFESVGTRSYDLVTSRGRILDPATGKQACFGSEWNFLKLGRRMVVCHPGMLHRRSLFEQHGIFDTKYRIAGDLDFLLRLPQNIKSLHIDVVSVVIEAAGISRTNVLDRLKEQRMILSKCSRYGPARAYLAWLDKLWRYPLARLFGIPH